MVCRAGKLSFVSCWLQEQRLWSAEQVSELVVSLKLVAGATVMVCRAGKLSFVSCEWLSGVQYSTFDKCLWQ